jgi:hypothetical protein
MGPLVYLRVRICGSCPPKDLRSLLIGDTFVGAFLTGGQGTTVWKTALQKQVLKRV